MKMTFNLTHIFLISYLICTSGCTKKSIDSLISSSDNNQSDNHSTQLLDAEILMNFSGYYNKTYINNDLLFFIGSGQNAGLNYYQLTTDNNLKLTGYLNIKDWSVGINPDINHVSFWSNYVAVSTVGLGLQIFDLTNTSTPQFITKINLSGNVYSSYYKTII